MKLSENGLRHLQFSEGSRLKAYRDQAGILTIGFGHTGKVRGIPIHEGMTITKDEELALLRDDIGYFEKAINDSVKVPLSQNQFDTLVSLAYNIGAGGFRKSGVLKALNQGDYAGAADKMLEYHKITNPKTKQLEFNQGLLNRRKREREMFLGVGEREAPNIPIPTGLEDHYYDNRSLEPQIQPDTLLQAFSPAQPFTAVQNPEATPPLAPLAERNSRDNDLVNAFEQLNGTNTVFSEPEPPKIDKTQYDKQLAEAFGIAPSTKGLIPDYIGEMIKSIYDQTA